MNNSMPEIPGYQLDQRLLQHPLAELWHGRTFTGMEVVALVLSEAGAGDPTVVERLSRASRDAALVPGQQETPLWAANFNSGRPYAITQLVPGQTGAERLIDPLDGILGNDDQSLQAVREQLSRYGAVAPSTQSTPDAQNIPAYADRPQPTAQPELQAQGQPGAQPQPQPEHSPSKIEIARQYRRKIGAWVYAVVALLVLIVFSIAYSIGTAIGGAVKDDPNEAGPAPAVSPEALPTSVLLPPIERVTTAPYKQPTGAKGILAAAYPAGADVQVITNAELPFALGWPRPPQVDFLGDSSQLILRRIVTKSEYRPDGVGGAIKAQVALHPCVTLAQCLSDRPTFDQEWTKIYKTTAPAKAKDARTWITEAPHAPYSVSITRAFQSGGQWWLVGATVSGESATPAEIQRVVNDIWWQTS
ncbi:hypothetical protein GCM10009804_69630 [Kribbella hippodromi]|uniref:Type VII secretion-associated protein n=1 Tax=Kribbella hippodromi TaxID=434347 RepID=A0ABN2EF78_9ACTN